MTIYPMILALLLPGQVKPKPDTPEDRAKRAAIVDRILADPIVLRPRLHVQEQVIQLDVAKEQAQAAAILAARKAQQTRVSIREVDGRGRAIVRSLTFEQPGQAEPDGEVDPPEPVMAIGFRLNDAVLLPENFDRWIFGDGVDDEGKRIRLQTALSERIDRVMKTREINMAQLQKLRLAGGGDIKRFLDRVEERRPDFEVARKTYRTGRQFLGELEPLATEFRDGPFGDDSFFAKILRKIEADSKAAKE